MKITKKTEAAAPAAESNGSVNIKYVPVDLIVDSKNIPYRTLNADFVDELSANIETNGLDQPLIVWKSAQVKLGDDAKAKEGVFLIAGSHRRAAIKKLRKRNAKRYNELFAEGVPVIQRDGDIQDALFAMLRENLQRTDMQPDQVLPVMQKLRDEHKLKNRQIAQQIGKSDSWVSQIFDIEETLGEEGMEEVKKGKLGIREAKKAAAKVKAKQAAGEEADVSEAIEEAKAERGDNAKRAKKRVSAKTFQARYSVLPSSIKPTRRMEILEAVLSYLSGDSNKIPDELKKDAAPAK